jgi:hypothetical protein
LKAQSKAAPLAPQEGNLSAWLRDPRTAEYYGPTYAFRYDVLAAVIVGGNLAEVGRKHGKSKQAAWAQGKRAVAIWGRAIRGLTPRQGRQS